MFDVRILVSETKVQPGTTFVDPEFGDLGKEGQASLVCRYFTGRSVRTHAYWYSPNNMFGKDQCAFFTRGD